MIKAYLARYDGIIDNVSVAELYFALDCKNDYATIEQAVSERNPVTVKL